MEELVLCLPTAHVESVCRVEGFHAASAAELAALLDPAKFVFRPRSITETDPTFLQLIPYVVLTCGKQVFRYRRGSAGMEKRLGGLRSIGIGGHISESDAGSDPYRVGLLREVEEEVSDIGPFKETFLGLIFDDRTPVGQVHLGLVHVWNCERATAMSREAALADAGWCDLSGLNESRDGYETWSQFVLDRLPSAKAAIS